jgi:16S rRNA processing protein RimM
VGQLKYLEILEITKPHGVKGEMRAKYYCNVPGEVGDYDTLYLGAEKNPINLAAWRLSKNMLIIKLDGVNTAEEAQKLAGTFIYIDRDDVELEPSTWFIRDIIGLPVYDADTNEFYGVVEEIMQSAPKDVYVLRSETGKQLLFPSIPEVLIDVNLHERKILIRPMKGLFDA